MKIWTNMDQYVPNISSKKTLPNTELILQLIARILQWKEWKKNQCFRPSSILTHIRPYYPILGWWIWANLNWITRICDQICTNMGKYGQIKTSTLHFHFINMPVLCDYLLYIYTSVCMNTMTYKHFPHESGHAITVIILISDKYWCNIREYC